jgi:hypothetical protein
MYVRASHVDIIFRSQAAFSCSVRPMKSSLMTQAYIFVYRGSYLWNHGTFNFDVVVVQALNECVHNLVSRATHECCRRACLLLIALLLVNYFRCHSSLSRSFYFQCIVVAFSLILLQWISKYLVQMFECHKFTHKRWCRYRLFANALIWRISSTGSLLGEGVRLRCIVVGLRS